ncbi:MAG: SGNH/GDSL hydrolase family protein [Oscillospiraceae bacterium]|nr:SGNH/GDSL hydrolase family protein [Oscillospiraceae bacterium]
MCRAYTKGAPCLLLLLIIILCLLSACNKKETTNTSQTAREIVCWGDSMTEGFGASEAEIMTGEGHFDASYLSYPEVLEQLTGITTYNFGVPGASSEEIAIMQGGIAPTDDLSSYEVIDYDFMEQAQSHKGDILVLEIGSNGGWDGDYATLISQYRAMIDHAGCDKYIIIGDTDDPGNSADDVVAEAALEHEEEAIGTSDTSWDTALRDEFGEHFINMRAFLIEDGLRITGLTPTEADEEAAEHDAISVQLRSDWTHFNSYGYYAQAVGVYQKGLQLSYWN